MLEKLVDLVFVEMEGPTMHLGNALKALNKGDKDLAAEEVAAFLIARKVINTPLNGISPEDDVSAEDVRILENSISGKVKYSNETYNIRIYV